MSYHFSQPDEPLSRRILSTVPFKERFRAGRLRPPVGLLAGDVRSLPELHLFLAPDDASLPGINLQALPDWIEGNFADQELAEAIRGIVKTTPTHVDGCLQIYEVLGYRLEQARRMLREIEA